ncbi:MAG: heat shock protein HspQ [Xanthobacteraceae bacterium]|nr:heat shock protein HspQ [Xanthobacteraceae bacterium]
MIKTAHAKFGIGQVMRDRSSGLRGMVFDVDAEYAKTELTDATLWVELPQREDQPFYYLFADHEQLPFIAYVPEQNLLPDLSGEPVNHPLVETMFERDEAGIYRWRGTKLN